MITNEDTNLSLEHEDLKLTDKEIFTKIWTSPRSVFKYINEAQYDKYITILFILAGVARAFERAYSKNEGDDISLLSIVTLSIISGGLLGWFSYFLYGLMIHWTGKILKAKGDGYALIRMMSYALIPSVVSLILMIPLIAVYGIELFQSDIDFTGRGFLAVTLYYFLVTLEVGFGIWSTVLMIIGISEIQKLSIGKAILNAVLPMLLIIIPIAFIYLIGKLF